MHDCYVFGYGSLIQRQSRRHTVTLDGGELPVLVTGLGRRWEVASRPSQQNGCTYLGVSVDAASSCNGVVFPVSQQDLVALDRREAGYRRVRISAGVIEPLTGPHDALRSAGAAVFSYVTKAPTRPDDRRPITQSYVDTCLSGCLEIDRRYDLDGEFTQRFFRSTTGWSHHWRNDRGDSDRCRLSPAAEKRVDQLLGEPIGHWSPATKSPHLHAPYRSRPADPAAPPA